MNSATRASVLTRRRRYLLLGGAAAVVGLAAAYKLYKSDSLAKGQQLLRRWRTALQQYTTAVQTGGDILSSTLEDLKAFLASDAEQLPVSLQQIARLLKAPEVAQATSRLVSAATDGVLDACAKAASPVSAPGAASTAQPGVVDKLVEALLSDRGHSLVSLAVSVAARSSVLAVCDYADAAAQSTSRRQEPTILDHILRFAATERGEQLVTCAVSAFVEGGTAVYCDKTAGLNAWDDLFSSVSKPQHRAAVAEMTKLCTREAVQAFLQPAAEERVRVTRTHTTRLRPSSAQPADSPSWHQQQTPCSPPSTQPRTPGLEPEPRSWSAGPVRCSKHTAQILQTALSPTSPLLAAEEATSSWAQGTLSDEDQSQSAFEISSDSSGASGELPEAADEPPEAATVHSSNSPQGPVAAEVATVRERVQIRKIRPKPLRLEQDYGRQVLKYLCSREGSAMMCALVTAWWSGVLLAGKDVLLDRTGLRPSAPIAEATVTADAKDSSLSITGNEMQIGLLVLCLCLLAYLLLGRMLG